MGNVRMSRPKLIYIAICLLFLAYLCIINTVIGSIFGKGLHVSNVDLSQTGKPVLYDLRFLPTSDDFLNNIAFPNSWAFSETEKNNDGKEISLVFQSWDGKSQYLLPLKLENRQDVQLYYDRRQYSIKGAQHGFTTSFSTISMKNGVYDVYLYVRENEQDFGIVRTYLTVEKDRSGVKEYILGEHYQSEILPKMDVPNNQLTVMSDVVLPQKVDEKFWEIRGWAFTETVSLPNQKIALEIMDEQGNSSTYETLKKNNYELCNLYSLANIEQAAFISILPIDALSDGAYWIKPIIYCDEQTFGGKSKQFYIRGGEVFVGAPPCTLNLENLAESSFANYQMDYISCFDGDAMQPAVVEISKSSVIQFKGWASDVFSQRAPSDVYLQVGEQYFKTNLVQRNDVVEAFNEPMLLNSGFEIEIDTRLLHGGRNDIKVIVIVEGEKKYASFQTQQVLYLTSTQSNPYIQLDLSKMKQTKLFDYDIDFMNFYNGDTMQPFLIEIEDSTVLQISGWAIDTAQQRPANNFFMQIGNLFFQGERIDSPDLGVHTLNDKMHSAGFEFMVSTSELSEGSNDITFIFIAADGESYFRSDLQQTIIVDSVGKSYQ